MLSRIIDGRLVVSLILIFAGLGCEKNVSDANFGDPIIFMPQAQIAALRYNVPNSGVGLDSVTRNWQLTSDSLKIILGVARSGSGGTTSYSVETYVNADTVNQLITTGVFPAASALPLPSGTYVLPSTVNVTEGNLGSTFYLSIHRQKLKSYAGKTVLLSVGVKNPTSYTLNTLINKVIIVINVSALNL